MNYWSTDTECCAYLIAVFTEIFPHLELKSGASEPFYEAPTASQKATIHFRSNYPRSLLHELAHYCLAGVRRRAMDDFGYWYSACGRSKQEQLKFELVEARPQGLERAMCETIGLKFSPSLDDFSGRPASEQFLVKLESAYQEMRHCPPPTAKLALDGLAKRMCADFTGRY